MDCQKLIVYGVIIIVGLYLLKNVCGVNIPYIESFTDDLTPENGGNTAPPPRPKQQRPQPPVKKENVKASDPVDLPARGAGIKRDVGSCTPQKPLDPSDLLPTKQADEIAKFNSENPQGDGILKGVNYLDAGFHAGVNTIGQSLRNANLNLREEPPNPRVAVSPWLNSTIDPDLSRKPLVIPSGN